MLLCCWVTIENKHLSFFFQVHVYKALISSQFLNYLHGATVSLRRRDPEISRSQKRRKKEIWSQVFKQWKIRRKKNTIGEELNINEKVKIPKHNWSETHPWQSPVHIVQYTVSERKINYLFLQSLSNCSYCPVNSKWTRK